MEILSNTPYIYAKDYILTALILLSKEKSLYEISVSELCSKAGVSRMSFYRNYSSIDDVIDKKLNELFEGYMASERNLNNLDSWTVKKAHIEHYFDYLYEHRDFIDMLISYGIDTVFLTKQTEYMINVYKDQRDLFSMTAFAGSIYNLYRLWSKDNYTLNKEQLISSVVSIFSPGTDNQ